MMALVAFLIFWGAKVGRKQRCQLERSAVPWEEVLSKVLNASGAMASRASHRMALTVTLDTSLLSPQVHPEPLCLQKRRGRGPALRRQH